MTLVLSIRVYGFLWTHCFCIQYPPQKNVIWIHFMNYSQKRKILLFPPNICQIIFFGHTFFIFSQKFKSSVSISREFLFPIWLSMERSFIMILSLIWDIELILKPQNQFLTWFGSSHREEFYWNRCSSNHQFIKRRCLNC